MKFKLSFVCEFLEHSDSILLLYTTLEIRTIVYITFTAFTFLVILLVLYIIIFFCYIIIF